MRRILISFIILTITGCHKTNKKEPQNHAEIIPKIEQSIQEETIDSLNLKKKFLDTTNTKTAPVKIISAKLLKNAYSDHKDIQLIYKNISKKDIKAVRFEWYCENSFDKPASGRSFFVKGEYTGETTFLLKKQKTVSKIWEDFSTDANTIVTARPYEVIFTNGTKWKLRQ
jgi:hypothetical protein